MVYPLCFFFWFHFCKLPVSKDMINGSHPLYSEFGCFTTSYSLISFVDCWKDNKEANLPEAFLRGLSKAHIAGRAQIVPDLSSTSSSCISSEVAEASGDLIFYLDGAHSPESMEVCAEWFSSAVKENNLSSSLVSFSSHDIESINKVPGNGYMQHEKFNIQEINKISKKVIFRITSLI